MWRTFAKVFPISWGRMRGREGGCGETTADPCHSPDDGLGPQLGKIPQEQLVDGMQGRKGTAVVGQLVSRWWPAWRSGIVAEDQVARGQLCNPGPGMLSLPCHPPCKGGSQRLLGLESGAQEEAACTDTDRGYNRKAKRCGPWVSTSVGQVEGSGEASGEGQLEEEESPEGQPRRAGRPRGGDQSTSLG